MNKGELIDAVAKMTQHSKSQTGEMFDAFMAVVQNALSSGNNVQMIGFGTFAVEERAARTGRNPATGKELNIPAKKVVKFKVGAKLKDAVAGTKTK
ncbi:MAG: HU family DNA-binding protein [Sulfurimicrobium sp.]|nr:HU family DNA-binding protein [Sulfurimicrobium sp.]